MCEKLMDSGVTINRPPRDGYKIIRLNLNLMQNDLIQNEHQ
jgi:biotin operon repressor